MLRIKQAKLAFGERLPHKLLQNNQRQNTRWPRKQQASKKASRLPVSKHKIAQQHTKICVRVCINTA